MIERGPWLVSRTWDVAVFGGSAALAFALLAAGKAGGFLLGDTPTWAWIGAVVFVDVAHVWATAYRVYLDPEELRRRAGLYVAIPLAAYVAGVLLYTAGAQVFWRVLAYVAVVHFVRQQYGWLALYRRKLGATSKGDRILDDVAIYSATLYPLLYWHANLPREFAWFLPGDFLPGLPKQAATWLFPVHVAITAAYVLRQLQLAFRKQPISHGKNLIVATTWLSWYVGIVVFDSDYAFTVTNVIVHGLPYLAFVWVYERVRWQGSTATMASLFRTNRWPLYVAPLLLVAWLEEWGWDRVLWHERGFLFPGSDLLLHRGALALVVPLLALPQATHYLLDAWIWRVRPENPELVRLIG